MLRRLTPILLSIAAAGAGCSGQNHGADGLATEFDSTGADTIVARVLGAVPPTDVYRLVEEMRIAPSEADTSVFTEIAEVDVDRSGRIWVFDVSTVSIFVFRPDGSLERRIGRSGSGPGEFRDDNGMVVLRDGRVAVWDAGNARIAFFTPAGDFERAWIHAAGFATSNGLATDTSGTLYVMRPVAPPSAEDSFWRLGLIRLADGGAWTDSLVPPVLGVAVENYVAERPRGGRSSMAVSFAPKATWTWHPYGFFVSGNGAKYHLHFGRQSGRVVRVERDMPPVPATEDERANEQELITFQLRTMDPSWSWQGAPVPDHKAPLIAVFAARDGHVWAQVATPSDLIPEHERPARGRAPVRRWRWPTVYEVFTADGAFLRRVEFPSRTQLAEADGDFVWGVQRDSLGLEAVVRFRVVRRSGVSN